MQACARANGAMRSCPQAASGIISAPPPSTDPFASRRSVTPISPRPRERPRVPAPGGVLFLAFAKGHPHDQNAIASRSRSIRTVLVRGRETREGARMRRAWMLRHGRQADAIAHGLALSTRRQCGASMNDPQRYGLACPSGARGTAVAYTGARETVFREATLAQLDRAAAKAVGRRFDPGTSHMDSSIG